MTSWKDFKSLRQMGMSDEKVPEQTFLFELSQARGFEWFQHIILVCSPQDTYSPFESSRIQVTGKNSKHPQVFKKMIENLMSRIRGDLRRVDVCMKFPKKSIDTFLGRAAHISLINDGVLLESLCYRYSEFL